MSSVEDLQPVFERMCEYQPEDVRLKNIEILDDEQTGEEFLGVFVSVPAGIDTDGAHHSAYIKPVVVACCLLVDQYGFNFDVEVYAGARGFPQLPAGDLPYSASRIAARWISQHLAGDLTLKQLLVLVFRTVQVPDGPQDALSGWLPEYELDWRAADPPRADEYDAQTPFEYWSSGKVLYPADADGVDPTNPDVADLDAEVVDDV